MIWYAALVAAIVVFLVIPAWRRMRREEAHARALQIKAVAEGAHEPASLHPWVDPSQCMGSGACVAACPEHDVLQVIDGQARIVLGANCVGHGACAAACPVGAIQLVFGSERRGVEIPEVGPDFRTNVPGLYVAGELGGMGLIANAVAQGAQALACLAATLPRQPDDRLDVVIVGAGPAGLAAGLAAKQRGLSYALLDQEDFGGAIRHYPRQKLVMTRPMVLPGYGAVRLASARKEALVALFEEVVAKTGLQVDAPERVDAVRAEGDGFLVQTSRRTLRARRVLLTLGRRGTPRRLGVPGEDLEKVAYRLIDPELFRHQHLLVVGGGDSAIEAACALADQEGNRVALSYRGEAFNRAKPANRERLDAAVRDGRITLLLASVVERIDPDRVTLIRGDERLVLPNDQVWVFAGGVLPTAFLEQAGVQVQQHHGRRVRTKPAS